MISIPSAAPPLAASIGLERLAQAWLAAGATHVAIQLDGHTPAHWPAHDAAPTGGYLSAPLGWGGAMHGDLRVAGPVGEAAQARLAADAALVARVLEVEAEMERMTGELIERQDELLALYDLAQSTRKDLRVDQTLRALVREAMRLMRAQAAFTVLSLPPAAPEIVCYPEPLLGESEMHAVFARSRANGRGETLRAGNEDLPSGVRGMLITPIEIRGTNAVLCLLNRLGGDFSAPDLKLARALAEQAGLQMEKVLLYQEGLAQARLKTEMDLAAKIQLRLLPQRLPDVPGLEIYGHARLAQQVGGDFYAVTPVTSGTWMFTVGDVSGKGMSAALLMSAAHTVFRNSARFAPTPTPDRLMRRINEDLYDNLTEVDMFVTAFIAHYTDQQGELVYANAGHSPVIYRPHDGPARLLQADGAPIGVLPESLCRDQHLPFGPGDILIIATDGFSEAHSPHGELFGYDRLLELANSLAARPAREIADALFEAIDRFGAGRPQDDDQTLLVLKGVAH